VLLWQRWRQGERPEAGAFLSGFVELRPGDVVAVLLVDQRERWCVGERIPSETYLRRFPSLETNSEAVVELAYGEYLLREERGEKPTLDEDLWRFPGQAKRLRQQIELHLALRGGNTMPPGQTTPARPLPDNCELPVVPGYEALEEIGQGGMGGCGRSLLAGVGSLAGLQCGASLVGATTVPRSPLVGEVVRGERWEKK
jgi:hypothetical protein